MIAAQGKALIAKWEDHVILKGPVAEIHCGFDVYRALRAASEPQYGDEDRVLVQTGVSAQEPARVILEPALHPTYWILVDLAGRTVLKGEMAPL